MLPGLGKRQSVISAVGSVLKLCCGTATLLDIKELLKTVHKVHIAEGDITHSVTHQMTYLKTLDSADNLIQRLL
jgi:hypothetical protein